MPTGNARNGLKQIFYILGALNGCLVCLRLVVSGAFHKALDYGNPRHLGYAKGYLGTLVVAAFPLANPMQGYGYDAVDVGEETVGKEFPCHSATHEAGKVGTMTILQLGNQQMRM